MLVLQWFAAYSKDCMSKIMKANKNLTLIYVTYNTHVVYIT